MGVVTRAYSETDGSIGEASSVNRVIDDLYTLINGNLDSANLAASAVGGGNMGDSSVIDRAMDYTAMLLLQEVV